VRPPQPEIGRGERAGLAGRLRLGQQTRAPVPVAADGLGNPLGGRRHRGRVLQPALAAVQVPAVDGPQQPRSIEHVGEPVLSGVGVADRVGQHHGHTKLVGQAHGPRGQPQRSRTGSLAAQIHALQAQARPGQLPPRREQLLGDVGPAGGQTESHHLSRPGWGASFQGSCSCVYSSPVPAASGSDEFGVRSKSTSSNLTAPTVTRPIARQPEIKYAN
jgi:hypothetical protein